ncbi:uncharacterized protein LOC106662718 [Cimex lectularius]|uniref:Uncharacterized protein n=1 Tax=Cimex lectularius TaxID=79782 RepID=A0A8I6SH57_CIMLE|nr:uncharacterized protein LOC106662718 [Cimex lectularius]XP_024081182.1 uncharacterized protein LOC106662718 [Cimex lectularius]
MSSTILLTMMLLCLGLANCAVILDESEKTPRIDIGDIAKELLGRSGSSQVLSLNLTNLVILLVLKGLLFGVTMYGGGHKGRSIESEELISETEIMLITSYLMGDTDKNYSCLYRVACQDPKKSKQYLQAAKLLLKSSKMFADIIGYDEKYETLVGEIQEAIEYGTNHGICDQKYSCSAEKNLNKSVT